MAKKIKIAIAGYGVVGKLRHKSINSNKSFELIAVCDNKFEKNGVFDSGVKFYRNYEDLLNLDIDAILVCLTNDIAAKVTFAALKKNKHVFCEKPPGISMSEIYKIYKYVSKNKNLKLMYGFNHRYHESVQEAISIVKSKQYGKIINMRAVYGKSNLITFNQSDWRTKRKVSGGGILLDQGIHMLDLLRLFAGEFKKFQSNVSNNYWNFDVEDNVYTIMESKKGVIATLNSSATQWPHKFLLEINLEHGSIILSGILTNSKSYGSESIKIISKKDKKLKPKIKEYFQDKSWEKELSYFSDCIKNNKTIKTSNITDAFETMKLVFSIYYSDISWRKKYKIKNPHKYDIH